MRRTLAGRAEGVGRPILLANEEHGTLATAVDGKGGMSVAIFDGRRRREPGSRTLLA